MIAKMKPKKKCHLVCDFLLGSCSKRISNVLEIAKEIAGSGMSNKDCTKCPVGFLNTDVWKTNLTIIMIKIMSSMALNMVGNWAETKNLKWYQPSETSNQLMKMLHLLISTYMMVEPLPLDHGMDIGIMSFKNIPLLLVLQKVERK